MGISFTTIFLLLLSIFPTAYPIPIELTDRTFEHQIQASTGQTTGSWFVAYYDPACVHCQNLLPMWSDLSNQYNGNQDDNIILAQVNTVSNPYTTHRFSITNYPTLLYFTNRKMFRYHNEDYSIDSLTKFIQQCQLDKDYNGKNVPKEDTFMKLVITSRTKLHAYIQNNDYLKKLFFDLETIHRKQDKAGTFILSIGVLLGIVVGSFMGRWSCGRIDRE